MKFKQITKNSGYPARFSAAKIKIHFPLLVMMILCLRGDKAMLGNRLWTLSSENQPDLAQKEQTAIEFERKKMKEFSIPIGKRIQRGILVCKWEWK